MPARLTLLFAMLSVLFQPTAPRAMSQEYLTGIEWPEPAVIDPGSATQAPSDAIVLFDGSDLSAWEPANEGGKLWEVKDGVAIVSHNDIKTKQGFGDCQLHIEWSAPTKIEGEGQGRGNSGVFLMDTYEIQVLDSHDNQTYFDGQAGAIYKQTPPYVNAMRPPGEWNVYDIIWTAPRFHDDGSPKSPAYITALHNGVLVLNHFELLGDTPFHRPPEYNQHSDKLPIRLQYHGNPVRFRNIWVREIKPIEGKQVKPPFFRNHGTGEETPVERSGPVSGKVTVKGEPLAAGTIVFSSQNADVEHAAKVSDGEFTLPEGALPPGTFRVSIERMTGEKPLPARYSDKRMSSLTVVIPPRGHTALEFDLADK